MLKKFLAATTLLLSTSSYAAEIKDDMYPEQIGNLQKHTFILDELENEVDAVIEITGTVLMKTDCNVRNLRNKFTEENLEGWGYSYYTTGEPTTMGTLMMCPEGSLKEKEVSTTRGELYRYNSKLPLVVYAPEGMDISYRVWTPKQ